MDIDTEALDLGSGSAGIGLSRAEALGAGTSPAPGAPLSATSKKALKRSLRKDALLDVVPEDLVPATGRYPSEIVRYESVVLTRIPGQQTLPLTEPVDLLAAEGESYTTPAEGLVITTEQSWTSRGVTLGRLLHSLALAPGESTRIAMVDFEARTRATRAESLRQDEQVGQGSVQGRSIDEVTSAVAKEEQSGESTEKDIQARVDAYAKGSYGFGAGSVEGGLSASVSGGVITNVQRASGTRDVAARTAQNITAKTDQRATSARSRQSMIVRETSQAESERVATRIVTNYNHMHALTVQYYEVVQAYELETVPIRIDRCLFVPVKFVDFTEKVLRRFARVLTQAAPVLWAARIRAFDPDAVAVTAQLTAPDGRVNSLSLGTVDGTTLLFALVDRTPRIFRVESDALVAEQPGELFGSGSWSGGEALAFVAALSAAPAPTDAATGEEVAEGPARPDVDHAPGLSMCLSPRGNEVWVLVTAGGTRKKFYSGQDGELTPLDAEQTDTVKISVGIDGTACGLSIDGTVTLEKGQVGDLIGDATQRPVLGHGADAAKDIAVRTRHEIWRLTRDGRCQQLSSPEVWQDRDPDTRLEHIAVAALDGALWGIDLDMRVHRWSSAASAWQVVPGLALHDMVAESADVIYGVDLAGHVARFCVKPVGSADGGAEAKLARVLKHLNENTARYSPAVWSASDGLALGRLLARYHYSAPGEEFDGRSLAARLDPRPVAVTGNYIGFRWNFASEPERKAWLQANELFEGRYRYERAPDADGAAPDQPVRVEQASRRMIGLPTPGVFAEAVLGRANSAEKLDATRFWNWQESQIPILPPGIADIQVNRRPLNLDTSAGLDFAPPLAQPATLTALPDPTTTAAVLQNLAALDLLKNGGAVSGSSARERGAGSRGGTGAGLETGDDGELDLDTGDDGELATDTDTDTDTDEKSDRHNEALTGQSGRRRGKTRTRSGTEASRKAGQAADLKEATATVTQLLRATGGDVSKAGALLNTSESLAEGNRRDPSKDRSKSKHGSKSKRRSRAADPSVSGATSSIDIGTVVGTATTTPVDPAGTPGGAPAASAGPARPADATGTTSPPTRPRARSAPPRTTPPTGDHQ